MGESGIVFAPADIARAHGQLDAFAKEWDKQTRKIVEQSAKRIAEDMRTTSLFVDRTGKGRASIYSEPAKKVSALLGSGKVWAARFGAKQFYMRFLERGTKAHTQQRGKHPGIKEMRFAQLAVDSEQSVFDNEVKAAYEKALSASRVPA